MKVLISGICGKMGYEIYKRLSKDNFIEGFDKLSKADTKIYTDINELKPKEYDLLIDFTSADIAPKLIDLFLDNGKSVISGTTGIDKSILSRLFDKAKSKNLYFYHTVNFASGFTLFKNVISDFSQSLPLIEIVESHNVTKLDIPSGSAKLLADILNVDYTKVKALRNHENDPMHTVIFSNPNEKVLVMHQILNRNAFVEGFMEVFKRLEKGE